ncbi:hypothetical protein [Saccharothrix yanglingensis]|uniref:hypothetical protein n=1 Tax=Saccharothrix yanglingensis TaxID=659496 RepID=UPI0027D2A5AF|nr:hypothetical protein [Saccharothrix yanglingensis]
MTALLHSHIRQFGTAADGRLFTGERNGQELPKLVATPLAGTPYDLRHAAVSTWLNGEVPAVTVAEWAGHSVEVLLKVYAKCLDGEVVTVRQRVEAALGHRPG